MKKLTIWAITMWASAAVFGHELNPTPPFTHEHVPGGGIIVDYGDKVIGAFPNGGLVEIDYSPPEPEPTVPEPPEPEPTVPEPPEPEPTVPEPPEPDSD